MEIRYEGVFLFRGWQNLSAILNSVCDDSEEVIIRRKNGDKIVVIDAEMLKKF